jgi:hypothetical protein
MNMQVYSDQTKNLLELVGVFNIYPAITDWAVWITSSSLRYRQLDVPLRGPGRGAGYAQSVRFVLNNVG